MFVYESYLFVNCGLNVDFAKITIVFLFTGKSLITAGDVIDLVSILIIIVTY